MRVASALARLGTECTQSLWVWPLISNNEPCFNVNECWSEWLFFFDRLLGGSPSTLLSVALTQDSSQYKYHVQVVIQLHKDTTFKKAGDIVLMLLRQKYYVDA